MNRNIKIIQSNRNIKRQKHGLSSFNALFLLLLSLSMPVNAKVKLPALVSHGMVLQREKPITLWGQADAGEAITVAFIGKTYRTVTDAGGSWQLLIPPQKAGGPYTVVINGEEIRNVMLGDVWLCAGQSNMETPVPRLLSLYGEEIRTYANPMIRYVKIPAAYNFHAPQTDAPAAPWLELTTENAMQYSGVPYFFAKEMYEKTKTAVGIINTGVGGTPIEAWVSEESLADYPAYLNDKRICESDEYVAAMQRAAGIPSRRYAEIMTKNDLGINEPIRWSDTEYDDSAWDTTPMFDNSWSRNGMRPIFGVFWLRRYIDIPKSLSGKKATLYLGRIEGADSVYLNGLYAGNTTYQYPPRIYSIPDGALLPGRNLLAVRMSGGGVSFVKDKPYKLLFEDGSEISVEGEWKYRHGVIMPPPEGGGVSFANKPVGLYNGMIAPLKNHALKGIVWYQGESNADRYYEYYNMLSSLIRDWRALWKEELPFLLVQLPNYMSPGYDRPYSSWAELRDVQLKISQNIPNTGMAVAIDIGEWNDIHPLNKKDIGKRLALQARKLAHGEKIIADGPAYLSCTIDNSRIILSFKSGTDDFMPVDELKGFYIAGDDGVYKPAKAVVEGKNIIVTSHQVPHPQKARYAWANNPDDANLRNRAGIPASPFITE